MKKIIVAGCGHGGLSAAARLAGSGFEVTVIEKRKREELGYDWDDCMRKNTFEFAEIPLPDLSVFSPMERMTYSNPKKSVKLVLPETKNANSTYVDRKFLINYLIDFAEKCSVKFIFEAEIISPVCDKNKVAGVLYCKDGKIDDAYADLVIDACGLNSPLRRKLPSHFGIQREISYENVFTVWRGYFESGGDSAEGSFNVYFYHNKRPGMDWVIRKKGYYDIMVGSFGELKEEDVKKAVSDFENIYPDMTDKLIRGGSFGKIPVGKFLPLLVCDGYALVGDSAAMTEPLSGSGIDLSIRAGKILADTVIKYESAKKEHLWEYNYRFFKECAERYYNDVIIKGFLSSVEADDVDFFFENKILTEKELSDGGKTKYSFDELMKKASVLKKPKLMPRLLGVLSKLDAASKAKKCIPEKYNENEIEKFIEIYSGF